MDQKSKSCTHIPIIIFKDRDFNKTEVIFHKYFSTILLEITRMHTISQLTSAKQIRQEINRKIKRYS